MEALEGFKSGAQPLEQLTQEQIGAMKQTLQRMRAEVRRLLCVALRMWQSR